MDASNVSGLAQDSLSLSSILSAILTENSLLFITKQAHVHQLGGRELLSSLNERALDGIYGGKLIRYSIADIRKSFLVKAVDAFRGFVDGLSITSISRILQLIHDEKPSQVFIDGSNLGVVAKAIKAKYPRLEVVTFYHNVETRFFIGALLCHKSPKALAVLFGNYLAERAATNFSDKRICLNQRDSDVLRKIFGHKATHISPMAVTRPEPPPVQSSPFAIKDDFVLFVGGSFYANLAAIKWFRRFISPRFSLPLYVVGRGYDQVRERLTLPGKILIVGSVGDLSEWYKSAKFVVAPIFGGSGMKTKVAEALMYGKKIVGTPEAFTGYEAMLPRAGWSCRTPEEFLNACHMALLASRDSADEALIQIYEDNFSFVSAQRRLRDILVSS